MARIVHERWWTPVFESEPTAAPAAVTASWAMGQWGFLKL
jgi:hypothetical protein